MDAIAAALLIALALAVGLIVAWRWRVTISRGRLSEERRRRMLEVINEAYVALDADGIVTDWNRQATALFGYSREEAIGGSAKELFVPPEDHGEFDWLMRNYLGGERDPETLELRAERGALRKDGSRFTVELAAAVLEHGGELTLHNFMHDITDRKLAEEEAAAGAADVEALAEATGALARSTEPADARKAICEVAARVAGAEVTGLFEPDASGRGLEIKASRGAALEGRFLPLDSEESGAVRSFKSRAPLFVADVEGTSGVSQQLVRLTGAKSVLWVPVMSGSDALGVIAVVWRTPQAQAGERVSRVMALVAAEAAVAIERAELLDRLGRMALTDDLTGLPNRRAWDQEVARELNRSRRSGAPLTVAMVDLDHFKDFNDEHGHRAGDRLLKEAAGSWRSVLRETDVLARYGGEEFVVALPGCDLPEAVELLERLRAATPAGQSCSAGVVLWDRAEDAGDLLHRADTALYDAKQDGRNRTVAI